MATARIVEQVNESPLADTEKKELASILMGLDKKHQLELSRLFEDSPWLIPYLYVNVAAKKYALSKDDRDSFRTIIDNEIEILQTIDEAESR